MEAQEKNTNISQLVEILKANVSNANKPIVDQYFVIKRYNDVLVCRDKNHFSSYGEAKKYLMYWIKDTLDLVSKGKIKKDAELVDESLKSMTDDDFYILREKLLSTNYIKILSADYGRYI